MRIALTFVLLAILLVALPWRARGAPPACVWKEPSKSPRLFVDGSVAYFRRYHDAEWAACAAPRGAQVEVQWRVGADAASPPVQTDKLDLRGSARDGLQKLESRLFPSKACEGRPNAARPKLAVTGLPGEERVSEMVPVRATVAATGALAPLALTSRVIEFPCLACKHSGRHSLDVRASRERSPSLEGKLDASWFECARHGANLALRAFRGRTSEEVVRAIRPAFELQGLEKEFVRRGDEYVIDKRLPMSRLCAEGPAVWGFELWGRGELMRAGHGNRWIYTLDCR